MMEAFLIKTHLTITQDNRIDTKTAEGSNVLKKKKMEKYSAFLFLVLFLSILTYFLFIQQWANLPILSFSQHIPAYAATPSRES